VFISEFHYDNVGTDVDEQIELSGPAGLSVAGWSLVLYNGNGGVTYRTIPLSGTFADLCDGRGVLVFDATAIQNGVPDGIALITPGNSVAEFLSYGGSFAATNGPANGMMAVDVVVDEAPAPPIGRSL
jgi:hypothetical protein